MTNSSFFVSDEALSREEMKQVSGGLAAPTVSCHYDRWDGTSTTSNCSLTLAQCQNLANDTCNIDWFCDQATCTQVN